METNIENDSVQSFDKNSKIRWVRSENNKMIAGVCGGIGEALDVEPWIIRFITAFSMLIFGVGFLYYFIFWICFPKRSQYEKHNKSKLLGVCYKASKRANLEVGVLRAIFIFSILASAGMTLIVYILLAIFMPDSKDKTESLKI